MIAGPSVLVEHAHFQHVGPRGVVVLDDVCLTVGRGEIVCLLGRNGAGKTTLLECIAGLRAPSSGVAGVLGGASRIAFLHQDYRQTNFPWATVLDNVCFPLAFRGVERAAREQRGREWLSRLAPELAASERVSSLSGGQQQAVALTRALASSPDVLLADEPLSAMDPIRSLRLLAEVRAWHRSEHVPILWICHNVDEALLLGNKVAILSKSSRRMKPLVEVPPPPAGATRGRNLAAEALRDRLVEELLADDGF